MYDVTRFVGDLRARRVTLHIARDNHITKTGNRRKTAIDGRTTRRPGYNIFQLCRKRIEEVFAWVKTIAGLAKTRFRGHRRVDAAFTFAFASRSRQDCSCAGFSDAGDQMSAFSPSDSASPQTLDMAVAQRRG